MKTIKEWLEELEEPYRSKALINASKHTLKMVAGDLPTALMNAFNFTKSKEGWGYWSKVVSDIFESSSETPLTHEFPQGGGVVVSDKNPQKALELLMLAVDAGTLINMLKDKAEELGYNLVEKPYEPKVGDFGVFRNKPTEFKHYGFLSNILNVDTGDVVYKYVDYAGIAWERFRKLNEQEKIKIQENW